MPLYGKKQGYESCKLMIKFNCDQYSNNNSNYGEQQFKGDIVSEWIEFDHQRGLYI